MIIFSYFSTFHSSIVPVSDENTTSISFHRHPNSLMQSLTKIHASIHNSDILFIPISFVIKTSGNTKATILYYLK